MDILDNIPDLNVKLALFNDTIKLFSQHNVAEEVVLYSTVKNLGLKQLYDTALEQTRQFEKLLTELDQKYSTGCNDTRQFQEDILKLKESFNKHVSLIESTEMVAILESKLSQENIDSINHWFDQIKSVAPTRPPATGELLSGPALVYVDKFRDISKRFSAP